LQPISLTTPINLFDGTTHDDFGFHSNCPQLAQLFSAGDLNVVCNAGNMITPVDRLAYVNGAVALPPQFVVRCSRPR
jgi:hypothetical protein